MKNIKIKMSKDQKSIFVRANNAVVNKTAIININKNSFINLVIEKDNDKNILVLQTDSVLLELMYFHNIEDALKVKLEIEKKLFKENWLNLLSNNLRKTMVGILSLSLIVFVPTYAYYKIEQISMFNKMVMLEKDNQNIDDISQNKLSSQDEEKTLEDLTKKKNLTIKDQEKLNNIESRSIADEQGDTQKVSPSSDTDVNDNIIELQNKLIQLSKIGNLTQKDKDEISNIKSILLADQQNKKMLNEQPVNSTDSHSDDNKEELNQLVKDRQAHMNDMLEEIKEKSFQNK